MCALSAFSYRRIAAAAATVLALAGPGCGNWMKAGTVIQAAPGSYGKGTVTGYVDPTANGGFPNDTGYNCPSTTPTTTGSADRYVVCSSASSAFDISLHGNPSNGNTQICVFPVDVIDSTHAYPDTSSSGGVLSQCTTASTSAIHLTFTGARFNAAFVVPQSAQGDMEWCLANGNYSACPAYSYQRFGPYDTGSPAAQH